MLFRRLVRWKGSSTLNKFFLIRSTNAFPSRCSSSSSRKLQFNEDEKSIQNYLNRKEDDVRASPHDIINEIPHSYLADLFGIRKELFGNLEALGDLRSDAISSKEMKDLIVEEETKYRNQLEKIELELLKAFAPQADDCNEIIVEITAGIGGKEASLFSKELFEMYCNYANFKNWRNFIDEAIPSELGGIRHARIYMEGQGALLHLGQESGVHRVQRVPSTEKSGRIHTSTATVAVLPQTTLTDVVISNKDIIVDTMRSSGAGGQHVNKTDSAVRLTHLPTGLIVECQEDRSQIKNRQTAMKKLKIKLSRISQEENDRKIRGSRKQQVGTSARSDKVRTYNYAQDRITDHRLSQNIYSVSNFLQGEAFLNDTIAKLIVSSENERFKAFLQLIKERKI